MIVHDNDTFKEALILLKGAGRVFYSDQQRYSAVVTTAEQLESLVTNALHRDDIAIVGLNKDAMEFYDYEKKRIQALRRRNETLAVRQFMREHPVLAEKIRRRAEQLRGE